jgi:hypothetical protein
MKDPVQEPSNRWHPAKVPLTESFVVMLWDSWDSVWMLQGASVVRKP